MAFLVEANPNHHTDNEEPTELVYQVLDVGKRLKLSFEEMNEMRVRDIIKMAQTRFGQAKSNEKRRMATQEDIDNFYR